MEALALPHPTRDRERHGRASERIGTFRPVLCVSTDQREATTLFGSSRRTDSRVVEDVPTREELFLREAAEFLF